MSELGDIVSLFWAVDDVAKQEDRREPIAAVLPAYATTDPDVAPDDWVRRFDALSPGFTESIRPPDQDGTSAVEALRSMAVRGLPHGRLRSRRLLAIAALARAYPEEFGEDGPYREDLRGALRGFVEAAAAETGETERPAIDEGTDHLATLLTGRSVGVPGGREPLVDLASWTAFVRTAAEAHLLDRETADQDQPPCSASWEIEADPSGGPVTCLKTHFETQLTSVGQLARYMDPPDWPTCCDLWCAMTLVSRPGQVACYLEDISLDCAGPWHLLTCLDIMTARPRPEVWLLAYELNRNPAYVALSDGIVTFDSGSIAAYETGGHVCIDTVKRVRFDDGFTGAAIAIWACVLGYGAAAEDMALTCALHDPPPHAKAQGHPASVPDTPDPSGLIDEVARRTIACVQWSADSLKESLVTASGPGYTADALARDAGRYWARLVQESVRWWGPPPTSTAPSSTER